MGSDKPKELILITDAPVGSIIEMSHKDICGEWIFTGRCYKVLEHLKDQRVRAAKRFHQGDIKLHWSNLVRVLDPNSIDGF